MDKRRLIDKDAFLEDLEKARKYVFCIGESMHSEESTTQDRYFTFICSLLDGVKQIVEQQEEVKA